MMRVLIRVDASDMLGLGHVMRCLALADELKKRGARVLFAMQQLPGNMLNRLSSLGYEVLPLPTVNVDSCISQNAWITALRSVQAQCADAKNTIERLSNTVMDWIVLDHYGLGSVWCTKLSSQKAQILVIDDLADRAINAELILNQNVGANAQLYAHMHFSYRQALLGPQFALLRSGFNSDNSEVMHSDSYQNSSLPLRFLISFGGADFKGVALHTLNQLQSLGIRGDCVRVVAGTSNRYASALRDICSDTGYVYLDFTNEMDREIVRADIAIGAGGVSMLERFSLGIASIVVPISDNQLPGVKAAHSLGAVSYVDMACNDFENHLKLAIQQLVSSSEARHSLAKAGQSLCDGLGSRRVADKLQMKSLQLREIDMGDAQRLHAWRNDPDTRRYSGDSQPIDFKNHCKWLSMVLNDTSQKIWIASTCSCDVGVIRFNLLTNKDAAEISIYRVPNQDGNGWGKAMILSSIEHIKGAWPGLNFVCARIAKLNIASQRAFTSCGFLETQESGWYLKNLNLTF